MSISIRGRFISSRKLTKKPPSIVGLGGVAIENDDGTRKLTNMIGTKPYGVLDHAEEISERNRDTTK